MKDSLYVLRVFHAPSPKSIQFFLIFSITSHQLLKSHMTRQIKSYQTCFTLNVNLKPAFFPGM